IEQPGLAIAITDRANRLVCANAAYEAAFGSANAPPRIGADEAAAEGLTAAARTAWRDGASGEVTVAGEHQQWTASACRAGRADDRDRIYFAREGNKGSPQTLVAVPLADPDSGRPADEAPSLMLLLDSTAGLGGWGAESRGQTPQLEALLEQLPLGLAMTDRD